MIVFFCYLPVGLGWFSIAVSACVGAVCALDVGIEIVFLWSLRLFSGFMLMRHPLNPKPFLLDFGSGQGCRASFLEVDRVGCFGLVCPPFRV